MRPKTIIIHDNLLKKIYFLANCFSDEKITNYPKYYLKQIQHLQFLKNLTFNFKHPNKVKKIKNNKIKVKSNISKNKFKNIVLKAKQYIKKETYFR